MDKSAAYEVKPTTASTIHRRPRLTFSHAGSLRPNIEVRNFEFTRNTPNCISDAENLPGFGGDSGGVNSGSYSHLRVLSPEPFASISSPDAAKDTKITVTGSIDRERRTERAKSRPTRLEISPVQAHSATHDNRQNRQEDTEDGHEDPASIHSDDSSFIAVSEGTSGRPSTPESDASYDPVPDLVSVSSRSSEDSHSQIAETQIHYLRERAAKLQRFAADVSRNMREWINSHPELKTESQEIVQDFNSLETHCAAHMQETSQMEREFKNPLDGERNCKLVSITSC
ncbi:hypothetical protein B0H16DRAFT_1495462 [Mycena metata]|uniref:Uncharacterized protein n=1 Tax=Mycena metata TaxID=1033252 RepID=A0AAD7KD22_9AGAR|nr:hypothetical protein B0H16DRAFT_1495462 [Mycena metata]